MSFATPKKFSTLNPKPPKVPEDFEDKVTGKRLKELYMVWTRVPGAPLGSSEALGVAGLERRM